MVAAALAFLVGPRASSEPDGLEKVAIEQGFDGHARPSATADGPTAGYAVDGVDDHGLSTGLAGLLGVAVTFVVGGSGLVRARTARGVDWVRQSGQTPSTAPRAAGVMSAAVHRPVRRR